MRENDNEQQPKEQQEMHQNKQIDDGQRASSYRTSPPPRHPHFPRLKVILVSLLAGFLGAHIGFG
ncbi:serine protease, partial [Staphylococcus pseudintermedius]